MKRWWVAATNEVYGFAVMAYGERDALDKAASYMQRHNLRVGKKYTLRAVEVTGEGRVETPEQSR